MKVITLMTAVAFCCFALAASAQPVLNATLVVGETERQGVTLRGYRSPGVGDPMGSIDPEEYAVGGVRYSVAAVELVMFDTPHLDVVIRGFCGSGSGDPVRLDPHRGTVRRTESRRRPNLA